jgi:hypothetical protein
MSGKAGNTSSSPLADILSPTPNAVMKWWRSVWGGERPRVVAYNASSKEIGSRDAHLKVGIFMRPRIVTKWQRRFPAHGLPG